MSDLENFFGPPISVYDDRQALEDGGLVKVDFITGDPRSRVTRAVWNEFTRTIGGVMTDITLLKATWLKVDREGRLERGWRMLGTGSKALWLIPNETGGRTLMFAEDY